MSELGDAGRINMAVGRSQEKQPVSLENQCVSWKKLGETTCELGEPVCELGEVGRMSMGELGEPVCAIAMIVTVIAAIALTVATMKLVRVQ